MAKKWLIQIKQLFRFQGTKGLSFFAADFSDYFDLFFLSKINFADFWSMVVSASHFWIGLYVIFCRCQHLAEGFPVQGLDRSLPNHND